MKICDEIRKVQGGYIVVVRFPFHSDGGVGTGEVVCHTFDEVVALLRKASNEPEPADGTQS